MKALSGKELCDELSKHGWFLLRVHGSHHILGKEGTKARLSIPIHGNRPLKRGLLNHLLKVAGLKVDEPSQQ
jgi:predicted RNA binding protein YcfA (HicA-like mRNA interferase family)